MRQKDNTREGMIQRGVREGGMKWGFSVGRSGGGGVRRVECG